MARPDRKSLSFKTKLAATLCTLLHDDGTGKLVPILTHEEAKSMTVDQVLSLFAFDHHPIAKHLGGPEEHWNLRPMLIAEHREKSARIDTPQAAKAARISAEHLAFRQRLLAKAGQAESPEPVRRTSRPIAGSRASPFKKRLSGAVERRNK